MSARLQLALALTLLELAACEQRPPLDWHGQHVRIGTDVVDEVCGGSIARMDYVAEHVGDRLGLGPPDEPHEIYILAPQSFAEACRDAADVVGCSTPRKGVVLRAETARTGVPHELAHERVREQLGTRLKPFFEEGIAEAMQGLPCELSTAPNHEQLLAARSGDELGIDGYCYAGGFVDWLLASESPALLLEFHDALDRKTEPSLVRAYYYSYFGRTLEGDLAAPRPEYDGDEVHCFAPELEREALGNYRRMLADTTCSGDRVENDFAVPERVYVEWQLTITPEQAGYWQLIGELPTQNEKGVYPFVELAPSLCGSSGERVHPKLLAAGSLARDRVKLEPGSYWVRLIGQRDTPVEVDLHLSGPCDYGVDYCRPEHRCDGELCIPRAENPLPIAAGCSASPLLGDPCDDGLRCVGSNEDGTTFGWCTALCQTDADCPAATICHGNGLCGVPCESGSDCESVESCVPGSFGSAAVCLPSGNVGLGGSCLRDTDCRDGRICHDPGISAIGCSDPLAGCSCIDACDPADPNCPQGTSCKLDPDDGHLTCQP